MDAGIRFMNVPRGNFPCVDATSHVYLMYEHGGANLNRDSKALHSKAESIATFVRNELWCDETPTITGPFKMSTTAALP